ncbi:hypothetical protein [Aquiflexum sp.]|uniref:hypothetical protein n=1 Tax=Aquiflexum sp. TaxID=1872584 RepID=UPI003594776D
MDTYYRNDICNLLLWHLQRAGREVEKEKSSKFEESYKKRLKFQKTTDWKKFRACIDLFEDTEYAIISAFMFQLGDLNNKNRDFGEMNIRLYGILNAFYLQIYSIIGLATLLHYPNPKSIEKRFKDLPIYKLRGIAGSHTINFQLDSELLEDKKEIDKITSFRIVQAYLNKSGNKIVVIDENNIQFEFNLLETLSEYKEISTEYLINIINHSIESLVLKKADRIEMNNRLSELTSNLIDYSEINENKKYGEKIKKRYKKYL